MTVHPIIEEFAKKLVEIRDEAIGQCDIGVDFHKKWPNRPVKGRNARWERAGVTKEIVDELIADCVDTTMFHLLHAIDHGALKLSYTADDGKTYDLERIGGGETYGRFTIGGDKSFVARFTEKRFPSKDEGDPER